jgi:hypothetical protein
MQTLYSILIIGKIIETMKLIKLIFLLF